MNFQELQYAVDHQARWLTSVQYGGPYNDLMQAYKNWKEVGSVELHKKICFLARVYDRYLFDRKQELDNGYKYLLELRFELVSGRVLKTLKRNDLNDLSESALDLLVLYKYNIPYLNFGELSKKQYYKAVVHLISKHHSCGYCHSVFHLKDNCPVLSRKKCFKCGGHGHVASHCK